MSIWHQLLRQYMAILELQPSFEVVARQKPVGDPRAPPTYEMDYRVVLADVWWQGKESA